MKVLNLRCAMGHGFEGWFGSEADFQTQQSNGQLVCPVCGAQQIDRLPSAPRLNLSGARSAKGANGEKGERGERGANGANGANDAKDEQGAETAAALPAPATGPAAGPAPNSVLLESHAHQFQDAWIAAVKAVLSQTEDVGKGFAEEARRIHYGETEARGIRGVATDAEREALSDEGIEVHTLAVPEGLKGRTH